MRTKLAIFTLGSLASCLLVIGCGSGGNEGIDKATLAKEANRICKQVSGRMAAESIATVSSGSTGGFVRTQLALIKKTMIPGFKTELKEIRSLGIPEGEENLVRPFLVNLRKMIAQAEAQPQIFVKSGQPFYATEIAGRKFGVSACPITPVGTE